MKRYSTLAVVLVLVLALGLLSTGVGAVAGNTCTSNPDRNQCLTCCDTVDGVAGVTNGAARLDFFADQLDVVIPARIADYTTQRNNLQAQTNRDAAANARLDFFNDQLAVVLTARRTDYSGQRTTLNIVYCKLQCPAVAAAAECGNGNKIATEACDDQNTANGDGCSSTCTIEEGFECTVVNGQKSNCNRLCGNARIDTLDSAAVNVATAEQCDPGPTAATTDDVLGGKTCQSEVSGSTGGSLACAATCTLNTAGCTVSASNVIILVDPNGGQVTVDSAATPTIALKPFSFVVGSTHNLLAVDPSTATTGTQRIFRHWVKNLEGGTPEQQNANPLSITPTSTEATYKVEWAVKHPLAYSIAKVPDVPNAFLASPVTLPTGVVAGSNLLSESSTPLEFSATVKPASTGYEFKGFFLDAGTSALPLKSTSTATASISEVVMTAPHVLVAKYECKVGAYRGLNADDTLCVPTAVAPECAKAQQCVETAGVRSWVLVTVS